MLLAFLAWVIALVQLASALPFLIETGMGLLPGRRRSTSPASLATAILVPAHDEAAHIAAILAGIQAAIPSGTRLLVVADNCTDATAAVARTTGAEVIERNDPARRGKGYALAFGRDHLAEDPPQAVVVIDADCVPEPDAVAAIAAEAVARTRPIQSRYLLRPVPGALAMVQVSNFAFVVKNLVRQRGLARLGLPAPLTGTGMAFPWSLFRDAPLATADRVEDLALGIHFARIGHPPLFAADALVWSDPAARAATLGQRSRWEGGFLATARALGPTLLGEGLRRGRMGLFWLGLHVMTPPLALLVMANLALLVLVLILAVLGAGAGALVLSAAILVALGLVVLLAWAIEGRPWLKARSLALLPFYLLWKIPMYARLLLGRGPSGWNRTERTG
ncbi:glycosyltransferase family 2 protein [Sphingomonas nostoxanthinifaciens]|uniref:glycosyltransferase family 2 protein n=1 Tax=Sphingomonas nostoxanthinifaciens TaxID=2872652 RepID=UPI001CC1EBB5|nr:glycosyltransferase family 2 protein [Sphingomonas nostoxanthinifaciens]UAK23357.1 glycosyltransferase family 2 protein [Sphingomonas nostoxanthinifaciens]